MAVAPKGVKQVPTAVLAAWRRAVGAEHVVTAPAALEEAATATFALDTRVLAIIRPASTAEVSQVLRAAHRHRVPIQPVSGGQNTGYGSRAPARPAALLDLSRMNRIAAFDERLGTLTVEPGVTFQQAHDHLTGLGSRCYLTGIGGSPSASLVGNALERGDGSGPHGDVYNHLCALEVVLADGRVLHTGMARYAGARSATVHRWGVGPSLDGLFSQSGFGVVTGLTLWLGRRGAFGRDFVFHTGAAGLGGAVEALRELFQEGTLRHTAFLWDDHKLFSVAGRYPFEKTGGKTPLPRAVAEQLRAQLGASEWNATGSVAAATSALEEATVARVDEQFAAFSREPGALKWLAPEARRQGVPSPRNLAMTFWRKRAPMPPGSTPERERCGFLWVTVAVPFTAEDATRAAEVAGRVPVLSGFEPNRAFIAVSPRCLYLACCLVFDRDVPGEDARALRCHHALQRELTAAGFPPCRLGAQSPELPKAAAADDAVLLALKKLVDPRGILSPGKYQPPRG